MRKDEFRALITLFLFGLLIAFITTSCKKTCFDCITYTKTGLNTGEQGFEEACSIRKKNKLERDGAYCQYKTGI